MYVRWFHYGVDTVSAKEDKTRQIMICITSLLFAERYTGIIVSIVVFVSIGIEIFVFFFVIIVFVFNIDFVRFLISIANFRVGDFTLLEILRNGLVLDSLDSDELTRLTVSTLAF